MSDQVIPTKNPHYSTTDQYAQDMVQLNHLIQRDKANADHHRRIFVYLMEADAERNAARSKYHRRVGAAWFFVAVVLVIWATVDLAALVVKSWSWSWRIGL